MNNPPAFPMPRGSAAGKHNDSQTGMTLRDYFAAKLLSKFAGRLLIKGMKQDGITREMQLNDVASDAYAYADAMLLAREKGSQ